MNISDEIHRRMSEIVALILWDEGAIKLNPKSPFKLVSGNYSPIYVNCRQVISNHLLMEFFSTAAQFLIKRSQLSIDTIAGGETAGIPYAAYLAKATATPMVYVRKAAKTHGIATLVEGRLGEGANVLLVEDLITDAGSKLAFIESIRSTGGVVENVLVLFDRCQGGRETLFRHGVNLHAVTSLDIALMVAETTKIISDSDLASTRGYLASPQVWHAEHGLAYST